MRNKTVVVVGGLSGIGRAVAELAAAEGAHVIAAGRRAVPADWPSRIRTASLDARDEVAVERFFGELGVFDHLVTTIGPVIPSSKLAEQDLDAAKAAFDVKFFGQLRLAKHAAPLIARDGSIVLTSGLLARKAMPGGIVKATMNAAVEALGKTLAKELAPLRVNVVSPGMVQTGMWGELSDADSQAMAERIGKGLPVGHVGQASDLALAYLLLMKNGFMTGTVVDVEGGGLL